MLACYAGHLDVVKYLRRHGASWKTRDLGGCTALHWAADGGHCGVVEWMLKDGCEVRSPQGLEMDGGGRSAVLQVQEPVAELRSAGSPPTYQQGDRCRLDATGGLQVAAEAHLVWGEEPVPRTGWDLALPTSPLSSSSSLGLSQSVPQTRLRCRRHRDVGSSPGWPYSCCFGSDRFCSRSALRSLHRTSREPADCRGQRVLALGAFAGGGPVGLLLGSCRRREHAFDSADRRGARMGRWGRDELGGDCWQCDSLHSRLSKT